MTIKNIFLRTALPLCLSLTVGLTGCSALNSEKEDDQKHKSQQHRLHWTYQGEQGPAHWAQIDEKFATCGSGKNQSPINLTAMLEGDLPALAPAYNASGYQVTNNGHTIQVDYKPGSTLKVDGIEFELKQFHFHSPSENLVDGKQYPLEAHLVHSDISGNLAVVALLFTEGESNVELSEIWSQLPSEAGETLALKKSVNVAAFLTKGLDYYRFDGSLTTPPCSEGVRWLVLKQPLTVSLEQVKQFNTLIGDNNRPVQPLNARLVIQ